ncbi:MAG: ATP-binding protein [Polaribacter sp.]
MKNFTALLFILLSSFHPFSKEEVVRLKPTTSFLFLTEQDSTIQTQFNDIEKAYKNKNFDLALKNAFNLLDSARLKDREIYLKTNYLIGNVFYETSSFQDAIRYFRRNTNNILADSIYKDLQGSNSNGNLLLVQNYLRLGSSYQGLSDRDSLKRYKDSAFYFYDKVLKFNSFENDFDAEKAVVYGNLSIFYVKDSLFDLAKNVAIKSIEIHASKNDNLNQAAALGNLASIYLLEEEYQKAKKTYIEALALIAFDESPKAIRFKASLYGNLSWSMYKMKDYQAYEFQEYSYEIKDELRDNEFRGIVKKINAENNFDIGKELGIKQEEVKRLQQEVKNNARIRFGAYVIAVLLFIVTYYKFRQVKLLRIKLKQEEKIKQLKAESHIRILDATLDGKEAHRKLVAVALHDNVSALLSSGSIHIQASINQYKAKVPLELLKAQKIVELASKEVRDLSHTLHSSVLHKFGLPFAIKDIAEMYSNSQIKIHTDLDSDNRYSMTFENKVYNIVQELINNVMKHSEAQNAVILLKEDSATLKIVITDDGKGFDPEKRRNQDGIGINQIEARVFMLKGIMNIDSEIGGGTRIEINLPILNTTKLLNPDLPVL